MNKKVVPPGLGKTSKREFARFALRKVKQAKRNPWFQVGNDTRQVDERIQAYIGGKQ